MRLTLEEAKRRFPDRPGPAPLEYAGQWVAWNADRSEIVAHGPDMSEVYDAAKAAGCEIPILKFVIGRAFVG